MRFAAIVACLLALWQPVIAGRFIETGDTASLMSGPTIGNGFLGGIVDRGGMTMERLFVRSGVTDGSAAGVSTIIPAIIPVNLAVNGMTLANAKGWRQRLSMDSAVVTTSGVIGKLRVSSRIIAPRGLPHALTVELTVTSLVNDTVTVTNTPILSEKTTGGKVENRRVWCEDGGRPLQRVTAEFDAGRTMVATSIFLAPKPWIIVSGSEIKAYLKKGETARFAIVGNVVTSRDFNDPVNESERMALYASRQGAESLFADHFRRWNHLWKAYIEIDGDEWLQTVADAALYNLYSSIREGEAESIAPMGLTSDMYGGHIFWDADMWIHPVLAYLNPALAQGMIDYRIKGLPAAQKRARAYGYAGAMYPWEADADGEESTPTFALTGPLEHHITADVAIAAWRQYKASQSKEWLAKAYPMIAACADFWTSRATPAGSGCYSINNVVGADEYAIGVNDNAFTNGAAKRALEIADSAARLLGVIPDSRWLEVAGGLQFHRNADGIILEYEGYDGALIKQADVALLAYPLELITDADEIERTLEFYDPHLDTVNGPAMSHAVMAVNYARRGDGCKAYEVLLKGIRPYLSEPFFSIAETPTNGKTYFMTGAGALLQGIIFGLADPAASLPPHIKSVKIHR